MKTRKDIDDISISSIVKGDTISSFKIDRESYETLDQVDTILRTTNGKTVKVCVEGSITNAYIEIEKK